MDSRYLRQALCGLMVVVTGLAAKAQTLNGNAGVLSANCFSLTGNTPGQVGSVYFPDTLNLNRPFDFLMNFNFGSQDQNGADGMVFVLQNNNPNEIGPSGGSLGWFGVANSIGVEFDTYQNPVNDPPFDHIAVFRDGEIDHSFPTELVAAVPALPINGNIEDGQDHLVQITWDPTTLAFDVYFDCAPKVSLTIDLVNTIFSGDSLVYWGVSGASGGAFNPHSFCILPNTTGTIRDTTLLCGGDTVTISAPPSRDGVYSWEPTYNQSGSNTQSIEVWPLVDTLYIVNYIDTCGFHATDSIFVQESPPLVIQLPADTTVCEGETYVIDPNLPAGSYLWSTGATSDTLAVDSSGVYQLIYEDLAGCSGQADQAIEFLAIPTVDAGGDITDCDLRKVHTLQAGPVLPYTSYYWSTGDSTATIQVDAPGDYAVQAVNVCGSSIDSISVNYEYEVGYFIPNVFTPNGDGIIDIFQVENLHPEGFALHIFDRWGNEVFSTTNRMEGWDGTIRGSSGPEGVYYYRVSTRDCAGFPKLESGAVTLLR